MKDNHAVLQEIELLITRHAGHSDWLKEVCALLQRERRHYNWVGIYFLDGKELVLGPYVGAPSPHLRIPVDKGICGAAVRGGRAANVPEATAHPRYPAPRPPPRPRAGAGAGANPAGGAAGLSKVKRSGPASATPQPC